MLDGYLDHRDRVPLVHMRMPLADFRDFVEWLECYLPADGATQEFRSLLNDVDLDPPGEEAA